MSMKKNLLIAAIAITALASCSSNDFVGDESPQVTSEIVGAISFGSSTPAITRAAKSGADAATDLNNNFVVFGYKTVSAATQTVFDNYQVNYVTNTANTTESNSANWEYVSYKNLPNGVGTNDGVTAFAATTTGDLNNSSAIDQSIKYWDFNASQYDFFAYSLGAGNTSTWAKATAMSNSTYSLEGTAAQLGTCYISNKKTITPSTSATEVDLEFRSFLTKVQLGFYETIPGYSVKEVKFYPSSSGSSTTTPSLYTASEVIPNGGKYTVTFDASGKAQVALATSDPTPTKISKIDFNTTLTDYVGADYKEDNTSTVYLGRASSAATKTNEVNVLPNPANENALNLKMDFTLVSRDGTGETIEMKGATAVIPAAYAQWKPNYKYTYLFKISDNTNAQSGSITGLYPITLDAVITDAQDGSQETITTVSNPSITTYAKASAVLTDNEYKSGANIYVVVNDGVALTVGTNAKLYTATVEDGAAQGITEETVKNAIVTNNDGYDIGVKLDAETSLDGYYTFNGTTYVACDTDGKADGATTYYKPATYSVKDANGKKLVINAATGLEATTEIVATDSPTGVAITVNGAKFTPSAAGYYVFEFTDTSDGNKKYYKVIKVVAAS